MFFLYISSSKQPIVPSERLQPVLFIYIDNLVLNNLVLVD